MENRLALAALLISCCLMMVSSADPVTHYYNLDVAHMTGTPDGFSRKMLGEDFTFRPDP